MAEALPQPAVFVIRHDDDTAALRQALAVLRLQVATVRVLRLETGAPRVVVDIVTGSYFESNCLGLMTLSLAQINGS